MIKISQMSKAKNHHNPISGHSWTTYTPINKWEVSGGGFLTTKHNSIKSAEKEKLIRESMLKKFPFLKINPIQTK